MDGAHHQGTGFRAKKLKGDRFGKKIVGRPLTGGEKRYGKPADATEEKREKLLCCCNQRSWKSLIIQTARREKRKNEGGRKGFLGELGGGGGRGSCLQNA